MKKIILALAFAGVGSVALAANAAEDSNTAISSEVASGITLVQSVVEIQMAGYNGDLTDSQLDAYRKCRATMLNSPAKCLWLVRAGVGI